MPISELYTQTGVTIGSTEYGLTANSTTLGSQTTDAFVCAVIESTAMAAGDEFEVAVLEKVVSGGTQRRIILGSLIGVQDSPFVTPTFLLMHGWEFSLKKIAGTDRAFTWSIRGVT